MKDFELGMSYRKKRTKIVYKCIYRPEYGKSLYSEKAHVSLVPIAWVEFGDFELIEE